MDPRNIQNQKISEVLDQLSLSEAEQEKAEAYLAGEAGDEILGQFGFRDLSQIPSDKAVRLFRELRIRGRQEEARRLFELLFAIGQSTCHQLVLMDMVSQADSFPGCAPDKRTAVYGAMIGANQYQWYGTAIRSLIRCAQGKLAAIRKAVDYQKGTPGTGDVVLAAAYLMVKYGRFENKDDGFSDMEGVDRSLQAQTGMEAEDLLLLKRYEDTLLSGLGLLFQNQMAQAGIQEILEAVDKDQVTDRILRMAGPRRCSMRSRFWQVGGMAYLIFPLSIKLKNIVKVCLAVDFDETLNAIDKISTGLPPSIRKTGGDYDAVFGMPAGKYIRWAAVKKFRVILEQQLERNRESYLKVMEEAGLEASNEMFDVIREKDKTLYDSLLAERRKTGRNKDMEEILDLLVPGMAGAEVIKGYLRGYDKVEVLYPYIDQFADRYSYGGYRESNFLEGYRKNYQDEGFYRRCQVYMLLRGAGGFFRAGVVPGNNVDAGKVKELFRNLEAEGLAVEYQLAGVVLLIDGLCYYEDGKRKLMEAAEESFEGYLKNKREETLNAFSGGAALGRFFGLHVMRKDAEAYKKEILGFTQDGSKMVKEELQDILFGQKGWEEEVKALLSSRKAAERELAVRVLFRWQKDGGNYQELFAGALEKEKHGKVRELLLKAVQPEGDGAGGDAATDILSIEELVKEIHKGGKKRGLAWAYETPFSIVHRKNGEAAGEAYLQAILLCYASVDGCGVSKTAAMLAEDLRPEELALYMNELFDKWLEAGAEAKKRWVLYAASIHGGFEIVKKLQHQIQEWPQMARGAIAAEAVQALSLNPLPQALLIVDGISRKFKFKQVKAAAGKALEFAAAQLGISREQLADRIVPDLGFDRNGERGFDYGERKFKVVITPALEIEVYDGAGKKLKNMPSPGKRDDEGKAAAAYEEFKQMKKQMKMTVASQKMRLELALSSGRKWDMGSWRKLFVENPVMHQFAIGLVWGIYEGTELLRSFRYMEDGSFNKEDEEEYELPEDGVIGLVHPIELSGEAAQAWKEQLEDYEIRQPIEQMERAVYTRTEAEGEMKVLERFNGCTVNDLSLGGKLQGFGWYRGPVGDGGCFDTYYRVDGEAGLGVQVSFSGSFIGGENEDVTVYGAAFYKDGDLKDGYVYGKEEKEKSLFLKDIPERYFSEIVLQLTKATASGQKQIQ